MSDQDVFAGEDHAGVVQASFDDLVGEDKKYKTQDDAAKALIEKDSFIEQLKRENAEAREALSKRINEEEFLKKLQEVTSRSPDNEEPPVIAGTEQQENPLTPEKVEQIVAEREAKKKREANLAAVTDRLQEVYGDNYRSRVQSQAKVLGVGTNYLTSVAADSPEAFYRLMELDGRGSVRSDSTPPRSVVNPTVSGNSNKKDYSYYQKLRQEKGDSWYFSIPVQQEIWKAAKDAELRGEQFLPG